MCFKQFRPEDASAAEDLPSRNAGLRSDSELGVLKTTLLVVGFKEIANSVAILFPAERFAICWFAP